MIEYTRLRLTAWGRWCRGRPITGYPTISAFMRANEGSRTTGNATSLPDDISEIDGAVAKLSPILKACLIAYYIKTGPLWWKATALGVSRRTFMRRVSTAEGRVNEMLDAAPRA